MSTTPTEPAPKPRRKAAPNPEAAPTPEAVDPTPEAVASQPESAPGPEAAQTAEIPVDAVLRRRATSPATSAPSSCACGPRWPPPRACRRGWPRPRTNGPPAPRSLGRRDRAAARRRPPRAPVGAGDLHALDPARHRQLPRHGPAARERPGGAGGDLTAGHRRRVRAAEGQGADHPDPGRHRGPTACGGRHPEPARGASTFAEPISNAIYGFTEGQVSNLVASSTFQDAWVAANREAHASLVSALTGENTGAGVSVSQGQVSVNLAAFIAAIKPVLVEKGMPFADRIPPSTPSSSCCRATTSARPRRQSGCSTSRAWCCRCSPSSPWSPVWRSLRPAGGRSSSAPRWWSARSCSCCSAPAAARAVPRRPRAGAAGAAGGDGAVRHRDHAAAARGALDGGAVPRHRPRRVDRRPSSAAVALRSVPRRLSGMTRRPHGGARRGQPVRGPVHRPAARGGGRAGRARRAHR